MSTKGSVVEECQWVPSPSTTRGSSVKLGASPDGKFISYGSGRSAVIRSIPTDNTASSTPSVTTPGNSTSSLTRMMSHPANVTVAKIMNPFYCASGDAAGNVKVWDTTGSYSIKLESKPISKINDIAFDSEAKRIVVVGEGRQSWGATFSLDTGSSIGEVSGHSKVVNAVAMKPTRPFRAVTASDDFTVCMLNGVPFKFALQSRRHARFVQAVDYSSDGSLFVSAGSDGSVFLYDGTTGEEKGALIDSAGVGAEFAHKGTIFAASFSKKANLLATSGADGTTKLWDLSSRKVVQTWNISNGDSSSSSSSSLQNQQVGNVWAGDYLVTCAFSGVLSVLDVNDSKPLKQLFGHQNPITALAYSPKAKTFYSGDSIGCVRSFSETGVCSAVEGNGHSNRVVSIIPIGEEGEFVSTGYDDTVKFLSEKGYVLNSIATGSIPKGICASCSSFSSNSSHVFVATEKEILVISGGQGGKTAEKVGSLKAAGYTPSCIAVTKNGSIVAVGSEGSSCELYDVTNPKELKSIGTISLSAPASAIAFSPDDKYLTIGLTNGKVPLYDVSTQGLIHARWTYNSARINVIAWYGNHVATGSLDESIRVYDVNSQGSVLSFKNAHRGGVSSLVWKTEGDLSSAGGDEETEAVIVTGGADGAIKHYLVKFE